MRRILLISVACLVGLLACLIPASAWAATPQVTLADPADGALITGGQPQFGGTVSFDADIDGQITVNIYSGSSAAGAPVQVLTGNVGSGAFAASASSLADGTYTAQAVGSDNDGSGTSQPVTFQLFNGQRQLTLSAPASPIRTAAPTFTGTALTAAGAAQTAYLTVFSGTSTDATPVAVLAGSVGADGSFSIPVVPGLEPGDYTAVVSQQLGAGSTYSPSVAFTITSTAASLTVLSPAVGASEPQTGVDFRGNAGAAYGDANTIDLTLYRGSTTTGQPVGTASVTRDGTSWSEKWPTALGLGTYTLKVTQDNIVNHPTTITHTFTVAPPGSLTGAVTISATGQLTAKLACLSGAGTCVGNVLIETKTSFQPVAGGPLGPLDLMFQRFSVGAAQTRKLIAQLTSAQLAVLRAAGASRLEVTVAYSVGAKLTEYSRATAAIKVG